MSERAALQFAHVLDIAAKAGVAVRREAEQDDAAILGIRAFFQKISVFQLLHQFCDAGQSDVQPGAHVADPAGTVLFLKRMYGFQHMDMTGLHSGWKLRKRFDDPFGGKTGVQQLLECDGCHGEVSLSLWAGIHLRIVLSEKSY